MKVVKKAHFSMFELMIALGLLSVLLIAVFGFYRDLEVVHQQVEHTRIHSFQRLYVQNRLKKVLSQISFGENIIGSKKVFFFTTTDGSEEVKGTNLILMYNNGINALPYFSQDVLARLYLDKDHHLCLATWPSPKLWLKEGHLIHESPLHYEVLLDKVSSLAFEFYFPPSNDGLVVKGKEFQEGRETINPDAGWCNEWKQEYNQLPDFVKVILKVDKDDLIFVLPVNNFKKHILIKT